MPRCTSKGIHTVKIQKNTENQIVVVKSVIKTIKIYVHIVRERKLLNMVIIRVFKDINVRIRTVEKHLIMI